MGQRLASYDEPITFVGADVDQYADALQQSLAKQFVRAAHNLTCPSRSTRFDGSNADTRE
ncbi:hypothetical protein TUA1478L_04850 [Lactiplantibacillus plantarum]